MNRVFVAVALVGFLLYRPYVMQHNGMVYGGDDYNYLAHATSFAYGTFPDYSKESNITWPPYHPIGPSLLAAPFVFVFSLVDRVNHSDVVQRRAGNQVEISWTSFGFVMATIFYLCLGILLLFLVLTRINHNPHATTALGLCILTSGILLYAYRRPVFSHVYEFFAMSVALYALFSKLETVRRGIYNGGFWTATAIAVLIFLTRYNNIVLAAAYLFSYLLAAHGYQPCEYKTYFRDPGFRWRLFSAWLLLTAAVIGSAYVMNHLLRDDKHPVLAATTPSTIKPYILLLSTYIHYQGLRFYAARLIHILFGLDWGLIYTAPLLLVGLVGIQYSRHRSHLGIILAALVVNLYLCIVWSAQGSWYGYRYFVFVLLPLSILGLASFMNYFSKRRYYFLYLLGLIPFLSMIAFEGNATNLTLKANPNGWINDTYQLEVWKTILLHPKEMLLVILKGGPLYLVYLTAHFFHQENRLPTELTGRYPIFMFTTLIKSILIWVFPLLFAVIYNLASQRIRAKRTRG